MESIGLRGYLFDVLPPVLLVALPDVTEQDMPTLLTVMG